MYRELEFITSKCNVIGNILLSKFNILPLKKKMLKCCMKNIVTKIML